MAKIGLFYGTDTGNTRKIAKFIVRQIGDDLVDIFNVAKVKPEDVAKYEFLIFGTPTLGDGELQDDWQMLLPNLDSVDFTGKTVALYGLGDQNAYGHEFVDGLGIIYHALVKTPAKLVGGSWSSDGYDFEKSKALVDGDFVGLVLDQDNQADLTKDRIAQWIEQIKGDFGL